MVASPRRQRLILPIAPLVAAVLGVLTGAVFVVLPTAMLEALVVDSGVAAVLSAAEPPLGLTARAVLALACSGTIALVAWFALFLALGTRSVVLQRAPAEPAEPDDAPVLRRADAHPDAPARRPVLANRDLGTPFLDVRAQPIHLDADADAMPRATPEERPLPRDLDQPLAAFDPVAMRGKVAAPVTPVRLQTFAPGERLETFPLDRPVPPPRVPVALPRDDPSVAIHALLDRLERSVAQRESRQRLAPVRQDSLEDTLSMLREMATRRT